MPSSSTLDSDAGSLRPRLVWITGFRTLAATSLLLVSLARVLTRSRGEVLAAEDLFSLWVVTGIYLVVIVQALFLRNSEPGIRSGLVHVAGDVAIATALTLLTGGPESPLTVAYLLAITGAAIVLGQRGALVAAGACAASLLALTAAMVAGHSAGGASDPVVVNGRLLFVLGSNVLAQLLTAVLSGFLARQLSTTGGRLWARERDLRQLSAMQQRILTAMPSGLLTCDAQGRVTYVNRAAQQILGLPDEWEGSSVEELIPGLRTLFRGRSRSEVEVVTPAGRRTLGLTVSEIGPEGPLLVVFQDLTDLRRAEQELRRADRLAELGALAAQLAHEIRNPLLAMRGSAQLLGETEDPDTQRLVGILTREADRLAALVTDFLTFSRPPAPVPRPCDLDQIAAQTLELLSADPIAAGVRLQLLKGGRRVEADPDQLQQVLLNLFRNALAAAGPGGKVRVSFSEQEGEVRIHVWDSGGSISSGDLPRLFEPFFTRRAGGTGLGLSTVHSIVRAHGGHVDVSSRPDAGTEFVVAFAAAERNSA